MAEPRDEMLREMARHRGLRLVKSRRRNPGGDFGRYGLTDIKTGQDCFGIGKDGFEATADEVEAYLRRGAEADWKRSLGAAGKAAREAKPKPRRRPRPGPPSPEARRLAPEPEPEPERKPESPLVIREARPSDAEAIAGLAGVPAAETKAALKGLVQAGEAPLVAERDGIIGCAAFHSMPTLRHGGVGRITLLAVARSERRRGVGAALAEAVEARLAERGCTRFEAVGEIDLADAHGFFRRRGYERKGYCFAKPANH